MGTFWKELECELTEVEWAAKSEMLAEAVEHLEQMKAEHAVRKKAMKAAEDTAFVRIQELGLTVRTHHETRRVEVSLIPDVIRGEMASVRMDTAEEIDRRPMTDVEIQKHKQQRLPLDADAVAEEMLQDATEGVEAYEPTSDTPRFVEEPAGACDDHPKMEAPE